jgi:hypothetical protein
LSVRVKEIIIDELKEPRPHGALGLKKAKI